MGFDRPGITPAKAKRKRAPLKRAAPVSDRASDRPKVDLSKVHASGKGHARVGVTAAANVAKAPSANIQIREGKAGGVSTGVPLARTVLNTARATVEAHVRDPIKQAGKDLAGARDAVKGAIGVPGAAYTVGKELIETGSSKTGAKLVHDVGADYVRRYKDAYNDTPDAYKKQLARQRKEGSFPEILDLASAGVPVNEGATATVRTLAKAGDATRAGRAAGKAVEHMTKRAPLRESAGHVAAQSPRRTAGGATVTATTDAARRAVQKRAVKRAAAGKKQLSPRRAAAAPGEVVGISERRAAARSRKRLATTARVERQTGEARVRRELAGTKGGRNRPADKTTRRNMQDLPSADHRQAALYAAQYGIRDSKGAKAIIRRRIKQVEAERVAAPLNKAEKAAHDELPALKALLKDSSVFDHPDVVRVADAEARRATRLSGPETGLAPERHTLAKYQPQADTLGVTRHAKESPHDYTRRVAKELGVKAPTDAEVHALARARGITRQAAVVEADQAFRRAVVKAKGAAGDPAHLLRRTVDEPVPAFVARVKEAATKHGLVEPGYVPSRLNAADDAAKRTGLSGNAEPPAGTFAARSGEVFRRGLERKDPELLVGKLASTVRQGARMKAESEVLAREGRRFDSQADAAAWMGKHGVDPAKVELVNDPVVLKGMAPAIGPDRGDYVPTAATYAVDKAVTREWDRQHAEASPLEKGAARAQSIQQAVLLGASPSWFTFQVLADSITLSAAGGLHKLISANREYRKMGDEDRELVDVLVGGSPANDVLIDKGGDQLGRMAAIMATSPTYRRFVQGRRPLTALLRLEGERAAAFRRAALAARADKIDRHIVGARAPLARIQRALAKDSPGSLAKALADPSAAEAAAKHVNEIMGDFANYTATERRALKSIIPFYGFMRYSMRTLLYTLPIDHPYVGLLLAQLGRLSADEARDIVGPDLPYGLSKFYNSDGSKAVDLSRASPLLNALSASGTAGQLTTAFLPPIAVLIANQGAGKNIFTGKNYKVDGAASPTEGNDLTNTDRARIAAHEVLKWLAPVRAYEKLLPPQTDDTLPFSRKPIVSVDPATANSFDDGAKQKAKQSAFDQLLASLLPLVAPQQPTQDKAAGSNNTQHKAERAALRTKRKDKRDAIQNDPLTRAKFQLDQANARTQAALDKALGPTQDAINAALDRAGIPHK